MREWPQEAHLIDSRRQSRDQTFFSSSCCSASSVHIGLGICGCVIVDDKVYPRYVNPTGQSITCHKNSAASLFKSAQHLLLPILSPLGRAGMFEDISPAYFLEDQEKPARRKTLQLSIPREIQLHLGRIKRRPWLSTAIKDHDRQKLGRLDFALSSNISAYCCSQW